MEVGPGPEVLGTRVARGIWQKLRRIARDAGLLEDWDLWHAGDRHNGFGRL